MKFKSGLNNRYTASPRSVGMPPKRPSTTPGKPKAKRASGTRKTPGGKAAAGKTANGASTKKSANEISKAPPAVDPSVIAPALLHLAEARENAGDPLGAIKSLETLIENSKTRAKCLPATEARARIKCASLLLKWTDNAHRAKTHLEAAQVLLKPLKRCDELRVQGLSLLGRTYKMMGPEYRRQRFNATQRGLTTSIGMRERSPEDATWTMWTFHYYLEHADACAGEEDWSGCENYLNAGLKVVRSIHGTKGSKMEVLFAVAQLQRALTQRASGSGEARVLEAAKTADEAMSKMLEENDPPEETARVRFHFAVMRTMAKLMEGDTLAARNDPAKLNILMTEVKQASAPPYSWLPDRAAFALAKLLIAEVNRPMGKLQEAMKELAEVKDMVDAELHVLGVLPQGGDPPVTKVEDEENADINQRLWVTCEDELQYRVAQDARPYLFIRALCLESIIATTLTMCKYDVALDVCTQLKEMVDTYPQAMSIIASHADMVAGHVFYALEKYDEASTRFARAASKASTPGWRDIGTLCSALAILASDPEDGASRALDLAKPIVRSHETALKSKDPNVSVPRVLNQTLALFTSGFAMLEQGRQDEAKNLLARALKKEHAHGGNNQLIASCLCIISGFEGTPPQEAINMAESAFTLSKDQEDLPVMVSSLVEINKVRSALGTFDPKESEQYVKYEERKRNQYADYVAKIKEDVVCADRLEQLTVECD